MAIPTPTSFWNCDESSGNLTDALGVNTLTNNNSTAFTTGLIGNAINFVAASSNSFSIADGSQSGLEPAGDFSMQVWIKPDITNTGQLFSKDNLTLGRQYAMYLNSNNAVAFALNDANTVMSANGSISAATWYHVVYTYDFVTSGTSVATLYLNGSQVAQITNATGPVTSGTSTIYFGRRDIAVAPEYYDGLMDMVGFWNGTVLSASDVTALYNGGAGQQYPFPASGPANVKTFDGVTQSTGVKTYMGVALASTKSVNGVS